MPHIEELLRQFPDDQRHVRFSFDHRDDGYVVRVMLTLPTGHLVAQTDAPVPDAGAAVDQVVDKLAAEVRRHRVFDRNNREDGGGGNRVSARARRRERDFAAVRDHLSSERRTHDHDGFFDILRPLLRQLRSHARRELIIAQLEGSIASGEVTVGDLLDELMVRAWDRWELRPRERPLDQWLVQLLHEILDERGLRPPDGRGAATVGGQPRPTEEDRAKSLYDRLRDDDPAAEKSDAPPAEVNPDSPYAAENGWAVQNNPYWPYIDSLTRDDVLAAEDTHEPWQELAAEEERRMILDKLEMFPPDQRRALALHVLEGWSIEDVARVQSRSPEQVRADIRAVRCALRRHLEQMHH